MRHLEGVSVDDALLLFDLLMATKLLAKATRDEKNEKLKIAAPAAQGRAAGRSALRGGAGHPDDPAGPARPGRGRPGRGGPGYAGDDGAGDDRADRAGGPASSWRPRCAVIREFLPTEQDDADLAWRAELTSRFASVRAFVELLAEAVPWGGTDAGTPVVAALRALPRVMAARKHAGARHIEAFEDLVSGSWRRLVFGNPGPGDAADRPACLHILRAGGACTRRCGSSDVYAVGADKWGDPRARLIPDALWSVHSGSMLTALGLDADPRRAPARARGRPGRGAYTQVAAGLAANPAMHDQGRAGCTVRGWRPPRRRRASPRCTTR